MYAAWKPPVSYLGMYQMMSELHWIRDGKCLRNADTYDSITCPVGSLKVLPRLRLCLIHLMPAMS
jgi:hypothetical protein